MRSAYPFRYYKRHVCINVMWGNALYFPVLSELETLILDHAKKTTFVVRQPFLCNFSTCYSYNTAYILLSPAFTGHILELLANSAGGVFSAQSHQRCMPLLHAREPQVCPDEGR